jgi:hypothetical protein
MNRSFVLGGIAMLAGLLLLVMKALAQLMPGDPTRYDYSLKTLLDPDRLAWIDTISSAGLHSAASWLAGAPIFVLLFGLGVLLMFISGMKKD